MDEVEAVERAESMGKTVGLDKKGQQRLTEKEKLELDVIKKYLPEIFSEEQTLDLVKKVITQTSASDRSDMGKVMALVMQQSNGKVDGGIANRLVKELLQ